MAKQTFTTGQVLTAAQMTSLQQTALGGGSTTAKTASYTLVAADAGTVVQMNSASATTITVNQSLFAQGDSVSIQNVGSGVCTVTAGSATVNTSATLALKQYDAGSLYFNTTSAAFFFAVDAADGMSNPLTTTGDIIYSSSGTTAARLGIGSTSQVLTVASGIPAWATSSSGSMTSIATGTLSGATGASLTTIVGTYQSLLLRLDNVQVSATVGLRVGVNTNTSSIYDFLTNDGRVTTIRTAYGTGESVIEYTYYRPLTGDNGNYIQIAFPNYASAVAFKTFQVTGATKSADGSGAGAGLPVLLDNYFVARTLTAITTINLSLSSGTYTGGTYTLFGVN